MVNVIRRAQSIILLGISKRRRVSNGLSVKSAVSMPISEVEDRLRQLSLEPKKSLPDEIVKLIQATRITSSDCSGSNIVNSTDPEKDVFNPSYRLTRQGDWSPVINKRIYSFI